MIHNIILNKLKSFFLLFLTGLQRAMCCFRRRRRYSGDLEPLTHVVTTQNHNKQELETWNDWSFTNRKPTTVKDHIEVYRQQQTKLRQSQGEDFQELDANFFEDMTPKITKQKKILLVDSSEENSANINKALQADGVVGVVGKELGEWEETTGWEDDGIDKDTQMLLREKKRQERERRLQEQQQKRVEKSNSRQGLGARL